MTTSSDSGTLQSRDAKQDSSSSINGLGIKQNSFPVLSRDLKTFVINMARRLDRRAHIEDICKALNLDYEFIEAIDGRELSDREGSNIEVMLTGTTRASRKKSSSKGPCGFSNLNIRKWCARWMEKGTRHEQYLRMAEHRLEPSELTKRGHELWGAVGCSLSHQLVLRRILADPGLDWALVLEDDATLKESANETCQTFYREMNDVVHKHHANWELIYLGGHLSTSYTVQEKLALKINDHLCMASQVYQTHAYIIRRTMIPCLLEKLKEGFAVDAALVSWSRQNQGHTLLFYPPLLVQPGGPARWKDSDIFVEGEFFKREIAKSQGGEYKFTASRGRGLNSKAVRLIKRGHGFEAVDLSRLQLALIKNRKSKKALRTVSKRSSREETMSLGRLVRKKINAVLKDDELSFLGVSRQACIDLLSTLSADLGLQTIEEGGANLGGRGHRKSLRVNFASLAKARLLLVQAESGLRSAAEEMSSDLSLKLSRMGAPWLEEITKVKRLLEDTVSLPPSERQMFESLVKCSQEYAPGVESSSELLQAMRTQPPVDPVVDAVTIFTSIPEPPRELAGALGIRCENPSILMPSAVFVKKTAAAMADVRARQRCVMDAISYLDKFSQRPSLEDVSKCETESESKRRRLNDTQCAQFGGSSASTSSSSGDVVAALREIAGKKSAIEAIADLEKQKTNRIPTLSELERLRKVAANNSSASPSTSFSTTPRPRLPLERAVATGLQGHAAPSKASFPRGPSTSNDSTNGQRASTCTQRKHSTHLGQNGALSKPNPSEILASREKETLEQLSALELRKKARYEGVCPSLLRTCLEKADIVEALIKFRRSLRHRIP